MKSEDIQDILQRAQQHSQRFLTEKSRMNFLSYHSFFHTSSVVNSSIQLCEGESLNSSQTSHITLAAWFHDHGFADAPKDHERVSCDYLRAFLKKEDPKHCFDREVLFNLVMATELNAQPANRMEEIIRDADLHYIGSDDFFRQADLLRQEWSKILNKRYDEIGWLENNIRFLTHHQYYTKTARRWYQPLKQKNLEKLQQQLEAIRPLD